MVVAATGGRTGFGQIDPDTGHKGKAFHGGLRQGDRFLFPIRQHQPLGQDRPALPQIRPFVQEPFQFCQERFEILRLDAITRLFEELDALGEVGE